VLEEFLAADIVVLGAPMYNFTIPSQLKAWIDRILVAGKTFKIQRSGRLKVSPATSASSSRSHAADFMARVRRLPSANIWKPTALGVRLHRRDQSRIISADGIQVGPEHREKAVADALRACGQPQRRVSRTHRVGTACCLTTAAGGVT